jgi:preprotein translocase subunit SecD
MSRRIRLWVMLIVVLAISAVLIALNPAERVTFDPLGINYDIRVRQGLDLSGGSQVLLQATDCTDTNISSRLDNARQIIEKRVNGLGVTEPLVQIQGTCRILVELPSIDNPADAIALVQQTGRLEFVDAGADFYTDGTTIRTTGNTSPTLPSATTPISSSLPLPAPSLGPTSTQTLTPTADLTATLTPTTPITAANPAGQTSIPATVYNVVMTGGDLDPTKLSAGLGGVGNQPEVRFSLQGAAVQTFGQFTAQHNETVNGGQPYYMCIVLDNIVQSCPSIRSSIPDGSGVITVGSGGVDEANRLVNLLRYGALPVALQVVQSRTIGPTLGEDSIRASMIAGIVGLVTVALFMLLYYRLPGILADLALMLYALTVFAIFRLIHVTLTLPGIAGFILSVGVAVDANILIFERMKEELRAGRRLRIAVDVGFERAWPSIRDSNISTLITCLILYLFGNTFGASIVKGFALTLATGVLVSLLTAIWVTRTLLHIVLDRMDLEERKRLFGI